MRKFLLLLVALAFCAVSGVRADDVAEAQKQFDLYRQYLRTDDGKLLDLFDADISVTVTITSDKGTPVHDTVLPASTFLDLTRQTLAQKASNHDTFKNLEFKQEGDTVRLTCTRVNDKTGFTGPFLAIYGKDVSGQLKMKAMKFAVPPPDITPKPESANPTPTPADIPVPKATP